MAKGALSCALFYESLYDIRMNNKEIVRNFLQLAARTSPKEAYEKYVSPRFKHHNQYFPGDRQSLLNAMEEAAMSSPNKFFEIKQIVEEGNKVVTYSHVIKEKMEVAVFHMFRIEDGKIVELWDVGQPISTNCPNENGLF